MERVPSSILDTDLYKFTMQQAVFCYFPTAAATYKFTNRTASTLFSAECIDRFKEKVSLMRGLRLTPEERKWLKETCPYFKDDYLDYLENFRFDPDQLSITFQEVRPGWGSLDLTARGLWCETILWEVPLMAALSEAFFETVDTDWSYEGQEEKAYQKAVTLIKGGVAFSEFGTRRRRSLRAQDVVIEGLIRAQAELVGGGKGALIGTSNVNFARLHNLKPIGTIAHEWFMAVGATRGYERCHELALDMWQDLYPREVLVALTDTFSTKVFFKDLAKDPERARHWPSLRQDSGDAFAFAPVAKAMYQSLGIDWTEKRIVYSDGLDVNLALRLKQHCDELGFQSGFGIGTCLSNDFAKASQPDQKSRPLNIVIKISSIDGKPCIKISDEQTKSTGDPETVAQVKKAFGLTVAT